MQIAIQAVRSGERSRARGLFLDIVGQDPCNFAAWLWLSDVADTLEEQIAALERAQSLCPPDAPGRQDLQRHLNELRGAAAPAAPTAEEEPVPLSPSAPAQAAMEPALPVIPAPSSESHPYPSGPSLESQLFLAERLSIMGKRAEAIKLLTELTIANPQDERVWMLLSELQPDPAEKCRALERLLAINPGHVDAARRLAALRPLIETPLLRGQYLEEAGNFAEAIALYRTVIAMSHSPADRVEATQRIANIQLRQEADQVQSVHPTLNLLRVGVGPALLFVMMALLQCGLDLERLTFLDVFSLFSVLAGGLLIAITGMRPMHPKWIELYGAPGSEEELHQRKRARRFGWLLMLLPFTIFLIEASFRLGALQASMMENFH